MLAKVTKTPAEVLADLGEELHGSHWVSPTARDLGINPRTISHWVSGKTRFTDGPVLDALRLLVKCHAAAVKRARALAHKEEN
jgi:hypothetical protein